MLRVHRFSIARKFHHGRPDFLAGSFGRLRILGFWYAGVLAVYSTLAFNFFFLPPIGTFTIADPQNWVALFAFLATAVIAGQLSERVRRETIRANQRRREIEHLYPFSQRLLTVESVPELLNQAPRYITETFGSKGAAMVVSDRTGKYECCSA